MLYELRVFYSHFPDKLSAFLAAHSFGFEHTMAVFAGAFFRYRSGPNLCEHDHFAVPDDQVELSTLSVCFGDASPPPSFAMHRVPRTRPLKTKELIPPPDGGPEPLTDTPTPYGD